MRGGVDEHQRVVADALSRCEADHERRSVDWVRRDRGVCDVLMLDGVDEHRHVVADALDRSEWSAKRSRSEREADHEQRSVDCVRGVCIVLTPDGVDKHRHVVADALGRSEWSAKRSRSEREADHERRSADMCKKCLLSVSLVNPKGKCWFRQESGGNAKAMCRVFRL